MPLGLVLDDYGSLPKGSVWRLWRLAAGIGARRLEQLDSQLALDGYGSMPISERRLLAAAACLSVLAPQLGLALTATAAC